MPHSPVRSCTSALIRIRNRLSAVTNGTAKPGSVSMAELKLRRPSYSIAEYFRAFPYAPELRPAISS